MRPTTWSFRARYNIHDVYMKSIPAETTRIQNKLLHRTKCFSKQLLPSATYINHHLPIVFLLLTPSAVLAPSRTSRTYPPAPLPCLRLSQRGLLHGTKPQGRWTACLLRATPGPPGRTAMARTAMELALSGSSFRGRNGRNGGGGFG